MIEPRVDTKDDRTADRCNTRLQLWKIGARSNRSHEEPVQHHKRQVYDQICTIEYVYVNDHGELGQMLKLDI